MVRRRHNGGWVVLGAVALAGAGLISAQAGGHRPQGAAARDLPPPPRPPACRSIPAGAAIEPLLDEVPAGSSVCLQPGTYAGPLILRKSVTLWGPGDAVIRFAGDGSTVNVTADHTRLLGFTIQGSGRRFDHNDSGVRVHAKHVVIDGLRIENALFGISSEESADVTIRHNEIAGDEHQPLGLRGDAIRLWETYDSTVEGNLVSHCRDILIWYSGRNRILGNRVEGGRYGTHFMFSKDQTVAGNRYSGNVVGIFAMYSHNLAVRDNWVTDSSPADGMGIGIKDSDNLAISGNRLIRDNTGIYLDASPADPALANVFAGNLIALNMLAVNFHASEANTTFRGNTFRNNQGVLAVEGRDDALQSLWSDNYFDDYQGYDLNHDGYGDVPYELRSFSTQLTARYPLLAFFAGSPALSLMDFLSRAFPLLQPKLLMIDRSPRMAEPASKGRPS